MKAVPCTVLVFACVACVLATLPLDAQQQLVPDAKNPRWLTRADGKPFFMCGPGDPEDFLYRGRRNADGTRTGDQEALIRKLAGTGANCVYLQVVRSHGGDGDRTHNPFVDNDPAKGVNAKTLDQWERWFAAMDRAGIVIFLFLYDDSARVWDTGDAVGPAERAFIRTIVGRFKHHDRLIWCVAEEYQERLSAKRVSAIAAEIRGADDRRHPIAVHKLNGLDFREFADDPNIDQFAVQYNAKTVEALHDGMVEAWRRADGRYSLNMSECASHGSGETARKKSWACAMAGAYVMILGMDVAKTDVRDLEDCGRLVRFFESTRFREMAPHDALALDDTQYVLAAPGECCILYTSKQTHSMGVRDVRAGRYDLTWFDCVTGRRVEERNVTVDAGDARWTPPPGLGREVALYVRRSGGE